METNLISSVSLFPPQPAPSAPRPHTGGSAAPSFALCSSHQPSLTSPKSNPIMLLNSSLPPSTLQGTERTAPPAAPCLSSYPGVLKSTLPAGISVLPGKSVFTRDPTFIGEHFLAGRTENLAGLWLSRTGFEP